MRSSSAGFGRYLNFKQPRPKLAGDKQPVVRRIVSYPVEHSPGRSSFAVGEQAGEVYPCDYLAGTGVDAGDPVGIPHVGVDFALDVLKLVELVDACAAVRDSDAAPW